VHSLILRNVSAQKNIVIKKRKTIVLYICCSIDDCSIPIHFRFVFLHAITVVQLPRNGFLQGDLLLRFSKYEIYINMEFLLFLYLNIKKILKIIWGE